MLTVLSTISLWGRPICSSFSKSSSEEEEEEEETPRGARTVPPSSLGPSRGKCAVGFSSTSGCSLAVTPEALARGHQVGPAKGQQQRQPWPSSWQQAWGMQGGHRNGAQRKPSADMSSGWSQQTAARDPKEGAGVLLD